MTWGSCGSRSRTGSRAPPGWCGPSEAWPPVEGDDLVVDGGTTPTPGTVDAEGDHRMAMAAAVAAAAGPSAGPTRHRGVGGGRHQLSRVCRHPRPPGRGIPVSGPVTIAIDGPAGSGKSTLSRALAARLGLDRLDTGAMYRSVAWAVIRRGIDSDRPRRGGRGGPDARPRGRGPGAWPTAPTSPRPSAGPRSAPPSRRWPPIRRCGPSWSSGSVAGSPTTAAGSSRGATSGRWSCPTPTSSCS